MAFYGHSFLVSSDIVQKIRSGRANHYPGGWVNTIHRLEFPSRGAIMYHTNDFDYPN